jgi:two-component system chemotaxis sensor kinase CheA
MNQDAIDARLALIVEQALQPSALDERGAGTPECMAELLGTVTEYLARPVPPAVRAAALNVAALSSGAYWEGEADENRFRQALVALRDELDTQREEAEAASQLACDPELVQEFLVEARAHLAEVETGILLLEKEPQNAEALNAVFRSFHTIKGLSGFLGAAAIHELAHETENLLDLARAGKLLLSSEIIELILRSADQLNLSLDQAAAMPLNQLPRCKEPLLTALADVVHHAEKAATEASPNVAARPESKAQEVLPADAKPDSKVDTANETIPDSRLPEAGSSVTASSLASAGSAAGTPVSGKNAAESSVVRIETAKLEYLIDMVGELVIAESVVRHDPTIARAHDPLLSRNVTQLARVVQEVQKTSMSMRMVAVGALFRKMSRLTRDLARKCGKLIELVTVGDDVELDRSIVEELADPMVHMIRNAVDHGLEAQHERVQAGKSPTGTVRLRAMHDAGDIVIEISDDGRGMDPARILAKARRQGLVGDQDHLDEEAILRLIFEAGFSTAEKVTDMSGRGVGMDVVRKQIQKLRGRVSIRSVLGQGSTFVLRLPLTLAIIDGLVVGVGSQRYILPMFAIREMFSPGPNTFVTLENRVEAVLFRDRLLPLIRLSKLLPNESAESRGDAVLIVVEGREQLYCIAVDQLIGKQEVVIKSLGSVFRDIPAISGGAILGDGRVGLIIDVNSLRYQG